jgi:hypothetical protein
MRRPEYVLRWKQPCGFPYRRPRPNEVLAIDGTGSLARSAVAAWDLIGGENGSELTGARTARLYMGWQGIGRLYVLEVRWTII